MARTTQNLRDSKGRYIKLTVLTKIKLMCNKFMSVIERWTKSLDDQFTNKYPTYPRRLLNEAVCA